MSKKWRDEIEKLDEKAKEVKVVELDKDSTHLIFVEIPKTFNALEIEALQNGLNQVGEKLVQKGISITSLIIPEGVKPIIYQFKRSENNETDKKDPVPHLHTDKRVRSNPDQEGTPERRIRSGNFRRTSWGKALLESINEYNIGSSIKEERRSNPTQTGHEVIQPPRGRNPFED